MKDSTNSKKSILQKAFSGELTGKEVDLAEEQALNIAGGGLNYDFNDYYDGL